MNRSGAILILASFVAYPCARASDFNYSHIADAVERCEGRLVVAARKAPIVDETLSEYVARLSDLRRESQFHFDLSLRDPDTPFARLARRNYNDSEDLRALLRAGLVINMRDGRLDMMDLRHGRLMHAETLAEPIWRLAYHDEGSGRGRLSVIGWSRTRHFDFANGAITPVAGAFAADTARPPVREDQREREVARLTAHAARSAAPSLVLEATGVLAERLVERARAVCRGEVISGELRDDTYPSVFLALAAFALRRDPVLRNMVAGAINEHVHGEFEVEARMDESEVFALRARAGCAQERMTFVVPADPFGDPAGWGRLL